MICRSATLEDIKKLLIQNQKLLENLQIDETCLPPLHEPPPLNPYPYNIPDGYEVVKTYEFRSCNVSTSGTINLCNGKPSDWVCCKDGNLIFFLSEEEISKINDYQLQIMLNINGIYLTNSTISTRMYLEDMQRTKELSRGAKGELFQIEFDVSGTDNLYNFVPNVGDYSPILFGIFSSSLVKYCNIYISAALLKDKTAPVFLCPVYAPSVIPEYKLLSTILTSKALNKTIEYRSYIYSIISKKISKDSITLNPSTNDTFVFAPSENIYEIYITFTLNRAYYNNPAYGRANNIVVSLSKLDLEVDQKDLETSISSKTVKLKVSKPKLKGRLEISLGTSGYLDVAIGNVCVFINIYTPS